MLSAVFEAPTYAPSVPREIQQELLDMNPKVFLRWSRKKLVWELWSELKHSSHPLATNELGESDRWNTDHQCWMRFFQNYRTEEGKFAPADRALIKGLKLADTWSNRLFYEEHIEQPEEMEELARTKQNRDLFGAASRYYRGVPNPIVAPYGRNTKADWRQGSM